MVNFSLCNEVAIQGVGRSGGGEGGSERGDEYRAWGELWGVERVASSEVERRGRESYLILPK